MSADREVELAKQVEDLTGLVVDLLTREPLDDEPAEPDPEYDEAVDRTNVLRPLLVEAHRVIADREGARYGSGRGRHGVALGRHGDPGPGGGPVQARAGRGGGDACERVSQLVATLLWLRRELLDAPEMGS